MFGVDLVVAALSAGAMVSAQVAGAAVLDAYNRLKDLLHQRIGREQVLIVLDRNETTVEVLHAALDEALITSDAATDAEVLSAARQLLRLVDVTERSMEVSQDSSMLPEPGRVIDAWAATSPDDDTDEERLPTDSPERLLVAHAPAQVPPGTTVSLVVRIVSAGRPVHPDAVFSALTELSVGADGTPVTITVSASRGLLADGPLRSVIRVSPTEDPDPVLFEFRAARTGLQQMLVTAWAGGTFLAEVTVEVSVSADGRYSDAPARVVPLGEVAARPGEATMEVRFSGGEYVFQLRSDATLFDPVEFAANAPGVAVDRAIQALQRLAAGGSRYSSEGTTRHWIKSIGVDLWKEMVPAAVRDQFWQIRHDMRALTIATNHDVIPWEILYPLDSGHDDGFLVERVPVLRRTYGQHRSRTVGLGDARYVVSKRRPAGAEAEIDAVRGLIGGDASLITSVENLLHHIGGGRAGALHFACHNVFDQVSARIDLDDGPFVPELLAVAEATRQLAATSPLVFLNACRTAGTSPSFTQMMGWAQRFMAAGAGAFVGTLWDVRTESSAKFAVAFYEQLTSGVTLGEAARAARTTEQDEMLDPTWLAYTVYGDPFATAA